MTFLTISPLPVKTSGQFFLTDDGIAGGSALAALIDTDYTIANVSRSGGVIIDVDGTEMVEFEARDAFRRRD